MASIWSRNKIWGGTFNTDVDVADNANNASQVPASSFFNFKFSTIVDTTLTRSKYLTTVIAQSLRATLHKEEDRATSANLGVSGAEPTTTKYVTVEQLPSVDKLTNDFSVVASESDGDLTTTQDMFTITSVTTGTNKVHKVAFSLFGVKWLKARTWKQSEIEDIVIDTVNNPSGGGLIPVGVIWDYTGAHTVDPDGFLNLCNEYGGSARSISNTAGTGTLHNDKYEALFTHLWTNFANTECPVSSGRGASAAADWAANKDIKLPDYRGRVGGYYKNADANFGTLGKQIGAEVIPDAALPEDSPWTVTLTPSNTFGLSSTGGGYDRQPYSGTNVEKATAGLEVTVGTNTGGGQKHFQPTIIQTAIIKY